MIKEVELKADGRTIIFYSFNGTKELPNNAALSGTGAADNPENSSDKNTSDQTRDCNVDPSQEK